MVESVQLLWLILSVPLELNDHAANIRTWKLTTTGHLNLKPHYNHTISGMSAPPFPDFFAWNNSIPPKRIFFIWTAVHGKINTIHMLNRKGIQLHSSCILCGDEEKSINHLLIHCKVFRRVWNDLNPKKRRS